MRVISSKIKKMEKAHILLSRKNTKVISKKVTFGDMAF